MSHVDFLLNDNVPCHYLCNYPFDFQIAQCRMLILRKVHVVSLIVFLMSLGSMSYVDFKKSQCHPVEFRGHGP